MNYKIFKTIKAGCGGSCINPNSQEAEEDGSYESGLHREFQANGEYS